MKYKNTLQKGSVRILVFHEDNTWHATGLEFNIVESGTTPSEAMILLFEALRGYLESAKKIKARPQILNQSVDSEYEEKWQEAFGQKEQNKSIFFAGRMNIASNQVLMPA